MKKRISLILAVALLLVMMAGCEDANYKKGVRLYEKGKYMEAAAVFEALGPYNDSADYVKLCKYKYADKMFQLQKYAEAIAVYQEIAGYQDADQKAQKAQMLMLYGEYGQVISALEGATWFFEDTSVNAVNSITFTKDNATLGCVFYDGNGPHEGTASTCSYTVDDSRITVDCMEGPMEIPYKLSGTKVILGNGEYFTTEQVEAALQGYWGIRPVSYNDFTGFVFSEYIYYFDDGKVQYESATAAYDHDGYYYYGPYDGTYYVDSTGLHVDARNNWQFGFVIRDGQVIMSRCGEDCEKVSGFKGEDGYSL